MSEELFFKEEFYKIIGICMKIHTILGKGFKEIVYKDAMEIEFKRDSIITYEREKPFDIVYEGTILPRKFRADFLVFNSIVLEIKAVSELHADAFKQTLNYLKASKIKLGILINFGADRLSFQRIVCTY
jgi:GxxExxY protein